MVIAAVPLNTLVARPNRKEMYMNPNRTLKNRYNGGYNNESRKAQQNAEQLKDRMTKLESAMDKRAAGVARTIMDMFKFVSLSATMLPNMEMETDIMRLKVDDDGIFIEITYPESRKRSVCDEEPDNCDDDEEGLLYDGD